MKNLTRSLLVIALLLTIGLPIRDAAAFRLGDHLNITTDALIDLGLNEKRVRRIADFNKKTDIVEFSNPVAHFDNELLKESSERLINFKNEAITYYTIELNQFDGDGFLGSALHTLQDFYAHSNWVEMEQGTYNGELGLLVLNNPSPTDAFCSDSSNGSELTVLGKTELTSGWWPGDTYFDACNDIRSGGCRHGFSYPPPFIPCDGISKDKGEGYDVAYQYAIDATKNYIEQINVHLTENVFTYTKGTLGMVIDDTGSMSGSIAQVKNQVKEIVNSTKGTITAPEEYLLVRFGDPDVGPAFRTTDADSFLNRVNSLYASGGGDCPELSQTALLQAIGASRPNSNLYLFTDASSLDGDKAQSVTAAAQAKKISITAVLSGTCSPIDPAYFSNTLSTGGQLILVDPSEVGSIFDLIKPQLTGDLVTILQIRGSLDSIPEPHIKEIDIPVDSTIKRLVVAVLTDTANPVNMKTPSNIIVNPSDPGTKIATLSSGVIFTIENPETGKWALTISGAGGYTVSAKGNSELEIYEFDFVKHVTYRTSFYETISGQPVKGSSSTALASLIGPYSSATFRLLDEFGNDLQPIDMKLGDPDAANYQFVGSFTLPNVPFRVAVTGVDENTKYYERQLPKLFYAQSVQVESDKTNAISYLPRNATTTLKFMVTNFGEEDNFNLLAINNFSFDQIVRPHLINLGKNETQLIEVDVVVPSEVSDDNNFLTTVTAESASNADISNSATVILPIREFVDDIAPSIEVSLMPKKLLPINHKMVPITATVTVNDAQDPNPSVVLSSITILESGKLLSDEVSTSDIAEAAYGTDDRSFSLRAKRSRPYNERTYTVTYTATDASGNTSNKSATVLVPGVNNGICGPVAGGICSTNLSPSSSELCAEGNPSAFNSKPRQWEWICSGEYGGIPAPCQENKCK